MRDRLRYARSLTGSRLPGSHHWNPAVVRRRYPSSFRLEVSHTSKPWQALNIELVAGMTHESNCQGTGEDLTGIPDPFYIYPLTSFEDKYNKGQGPAGGFPLTHRSGVSHLSDSIIRKNEHRMVSCQATFPFSRIRVDETPFPEQFRPLSASLISLYGFRPVKRSPARRRAARCFPLSVSLLYGDCEISACQPYSAIILFIK